MTSVHQVMVSDPSLLPVFCPSCLLSNRYPYADEYTYTIRDLRYNNWRCKHCSRDLVSEAQYQLLAWRTDYSDFDILRGHKYWIRNEENLHELEFMLKERVDEVIWERKDIDVEIVRRSRFPGEEWVRMDEKARIVGRGHERGGVSPRMRAFVRPRRH